MVLPENMVPISAYQAEWIPRLCPYQRNSPYYRRLTLSMENRWGTSAYG
jgi:hypothetical protein